MVSVDLNADLGESFGTWQLGDDDAMLGLVTWYVRRARRRIRAWIERRMPELSPASRNR